MASLEGGVGGKRPIELRSTRTRHPDPLALDARVQLAAKGVLRLAPRPGRAQGRGIP